MDGEVTIDCKQWRVKSKLFGQATKAYRFESDATVRVLCLVPCLLCIAHPKGSVCTHGLR